MKNISKYEKSIGACIVIMMVTIYSVFLANKTLPSSEGWYSYYAKCINDGQTVYTDFEYLFTPLYMYMIALFIKIFGYSILSLRILGVIIYGGLSLIIYVILLKLFDAPISVVTTVTGVFYLQSEVYTVFYDYSRVMDIFSHIAILFMIITIKEWKEKEKSYYLYLWGGFSAFFFLVKQNMGALFLVYSCMLILFVAIVSKWKLSKWFWTEVKYTVAVIVPIIITVLIFWKLNLLNELLNSVFFKAVGAKGGITSILFRWLVVFMPTYIRSLIIGIVYLLALYVCKRINMWSFEKNRIAELVVLGWFVIYTTINIVILLVNSQLGEKFSQQTRLDVTFLFIIDVLMMLYYAISMIVDRIKGNDITFEKIAKLSLFGAFFTLCYGAGMSAGLSIGESALGLALILAVLLDSFKFRYGSICKFLVCLYCSNLILCCVGYKMVYPCEWWGIDEPSVYMATEETTIPKLKGIKLSSSTANVYQSIYDIVERTCEEDDSIFCFPECPIFYVLTDKSDPGVYAKVQWFDVSDNSSVIKDIDVLKNNLPKVIIIHDIYDGAYEGHESAFNYGQISGTRVMRDALYRIVNTNKYVYEGAFTSGKDQFTVFSIPKKPIKDLNEFFSGKGTEEDPYCINNIDDLIRLANLSNQGYKLKNMHFRQTADIDGTDKVYVPLGYFSEFEGIYDDGGFQVQNINNSGKNSLNSYGQQLFFN